MAKRYLAFRVISRRGGVAAFRGCENFDRFLDSFDRALRGALSMRDRIGGAVEIEPSDLPDARRDQEVGRIAGKARARNAILHDVERIDHHRGDSGRPPPPKNSRFIVRSGEKNLPMPRFGGGVSSTLTGASSEAVP